MPKHNAVQVLPGSMSVTAFHFFQLTELSTVFLHISWMASKSQVQYFYLFSILISLLVTFAIRLVTTAFIVYHVVTRVLELRLWEVSIILLSYLDVTVHSCLQHLHPVRIRVHHIHCA